jgi:hypothetical protein
LRRTAAAPFGKKLVSCKIVIDGERRFRRRTFGKKKNQSFLFRY